MKAKNNITPLSEIIDKRVGRPGTEKRETFDKEVENLVIGLRIQESRKSLNMTQEELAITLKVLPSKDLLIAKATELQNNKDMSKRKQLLEETKALRDKVIAEQKSADQRIAEMIQRWNQES